jgi:hypothetical protein
MQGQHTPVRAAATYAARRTATPACCRIMPPRVEYAHGHVLNMGLRLHRPSTHPYVYMQAGAGQFLHPFTQLPSTQLINDVTEDELTGHLW